MSRSSTWRSARALGVSTRCAILARDGFACVYCETSLEVRGAQLDHVIPRKAGGPSTPSNLVTCCGPCNRGRQHGRVGLTERARVSVARALDRVRGRELARQHYPGRFKATA